VDSVIGFDDVVTVVAAVWVAIFLSVTGQAVAAPVAEVLAAHGEVAHRPPSFPGARPRGALVARSMARRALR